MIGKIRRFFVSPTATETNVELRPMTPEELAAFDAAFGKMNEAFDQLNRVFDKRKS